MQVNYNCYIVQIFRILMNNLMLNIKFESNISRLLKYFRFVKLTFFEILVMILSQSMMVDLSHLSKLVNFVEIHSHLIRSSHQAINYCFISKQMGMELFLDFRLVTTPWVSFTNQFSFTPGPRIMRFLGLGKSRISWISH